MTFSLCVRESFVDADGTEQRRFGVGVTTRLPGVGALCPYVTEHGAIATQSLINTELGQRGVQYLGDGLAVADALEALLNADGESARRQVHGVGASGTFAFTGDACTGWAGHRTGDSYTVAGNMLTGESVVDAVASQYEATREEDRGLAVRLVNALAAGQEAGGDKREELHVQSAAIRVERTEDRALDPYTDDIRVDATETPIADLTETLALARAGYEAALDRYDWTE